jgi:hypothetical protein
MQDAIIAQLEAEIAADRAAAAAAEQLAAEHRAAREAAEQLAIEQAARIRELEVLNAEKEKRKKERGLPKALCKKAEKRAKGNPQEHEADNLQPLPTIEEEFDSETGSIIGMDELNDEEGLKR